jgi:hypothetical protein
MSLRWSLITYSPGEDMVSSAASTARACSRLFRKSAFVWNQWLTSIHACKSPVLSGRIPPLPRNEAAAFSVCRGRAKPLSPAP